MTCPFLMGAFKASVQLLFFPIMVVMESSVQMEISLAPPGTAGREWLSLTLLLSPQEGGRAAEGLARPGPSPGLQGPESYGLQEARGAHTGSISFYVPGWTFPIQSREL